MVEMSALYWFIDPSEFWLDSAVFWEYPMRICCATVAWWVAGVLYSDVVLCDHSMDDNVVMSPIRQPRG